MDGPLAPLLRAGGNLRWATRELWSRAALPAAPYVLRLRLGSPVPEVPPPGWPVRTEASLSLLDVLRALERSADDPSVACVLLRMSGPPGGWARALSLQRAVAGVRASGKAVIVWSESYDTTDYVVASAASHVLVAEAGGIAWTGLRIESIFLRELLANLGLRPDVVRVGAFKSAAEMFTRDGHSPEQRAQLEALLDEAWGALCAAVAVGRGLDAEAVAAMADRGPFTSAGAREAGLIDGTAFPDELEDRVREWVPALSGSASVPVVDGQHYVWRYALAGPIPLLRGLPRIAYQVAHGTIARGRGARGIHAESLALMLRRLEEDDTVRAVVLRLDSGGGEVVASDLLWRSVERLRTAKPVIACFGDTAASGAYYLAASASEIVAETGTLTGSIGVVGGKLDASGLLGRLGIASDPVERGARAGLGTPTRGFTPEERKVVRDGMESAYERFLGRVAQGRGMTRDAVHAVAQGRVFTGSQARGHGLVDSLGGPLEALASARRSAGLAETERVALEVHPAASAFSGLRELLRAAG